MKQGTSNSETEPAGITPDLRQGRPSRPVRWRRGIARGTHRGTRSWLAGMRRPTLSHGSSAPVSPPASLGRPPQPQIASAWNAARGARTRAPPPSTGWHSRRCRRHRRSVDRAAREGGNFYDGGWSASRQRGRGKRQRASVCWSFEFCGCLPLGMK